MSILAQHGMGRRLAWALALGLGLGSALAQPSAPAPPGQPAAAASAMPAVRLRIVGSLGSLRLFTRHEEPFWTHTLPALTAGRVQADIAPFDRAGIRGQDMLRLLQQGVVPFGTALLSLASSEDALLGAPDMPGLNPDMAMLRRTVAAFRPALAAHLKSTRGLVLLAVYAYPAQVLFCSQPFSALSDLRGRRVRVSGAPLAELVEALGATPLLTPLVDVEPQLRAGKIDCAITGTMSGNTIGLQEVTSHLHTMALSWGLSVFAANGAAWDALSPALRSLLQQRLPQLEREVWDEAERETGEGVACNSGVGACASGRRGHMAVVPASVADRARLRELLARTTLPHWVTRCGADCAELWNRTLAPVVGLTAQR
jgi:TRAP-type C4-dicarboxylate transport system substrate-binding protein